jgi:hypothetical protein
MSTRARGDHDRPYMRPWRPKQPGVGPLRRAGVHPPSSAPSTHSELPDAVLEVGSPEPQTRSRAGRRAIMFIVVAALAGAGMASTRAPTRRPVVYPPTPRAWFDAYLAAAVDAPARVCRTLFAPALAARYRNARPGSCLAFFADVRDSPVRIGRVDQSGATAVIEARQTHPRLAWSVVLARHDGGWRAVDLISRH